MRQGFWLLILLACLMTPQIVEAIDASAVVDAPPPAPTRHLASHMMPPLSAVAGPSMQLADLG